MNYHFYRQMSKGRSYLIADGEGYTADPNRAGLFTDQEWQEWGKFVPDLQREAVGEDRAMKALGASRLPGFDWLDEEGAWPTYG